MYIVNISLNVVTTDIFYSAISRMAADVKLARRQTKEDHALIKEVTRKARGKDSNERKHQRLDKMKKTDRQKRREEIIKRQYDDDITLDSAVYTG